MLTAGGIALKSDTVRPYSEVLREKEMVGGCQC